VEELDGSKEGEGVVGDLVGFACGGEVRAKEKVGYG